VEPVTHLAFELRTNTPRSLIPALAERVEQNGYRSLWVNHPPDADGLGCLAAMASATARITLGTAVVPVSAVPPDAILRRIDETGLPAERLRLGIGSGSGERPLGPWRDTVDEVVLVPVRADEAGPARDLVDAAIAGF
jgi:alkanesulfonate monooxygenase SsuD/methylene tetrahydromethanopterin reductase-like flavin-dependent oxidoreductase (luciferase family)